MLIRLFALLCLPVLVLPAASQANPSHAVVFMYHRFGENAHPSTNIRLSQFEAQLEYLAANDYRIWALPRILRHLQTGRPLPDRVVAITVDDAYLSTFTEAYPRLRDRGWPFTVFVSTEYVDRGTPGYMSWEQMRDMQRHGATFANHSASHAHLHQRREGESETEWRMRVREDIAHAQHRLQTELGAGTNTRPSLFAYPYGEYDTALAELVRKLGYIGFGQHSGALGEETDRRSLPRYPISEQYADMEAFARKAASLPLPVLRAEPWEPVLSGNNPPRLRLTLGQGAYAAQRLACYATGQGRMSITWLQQQPPRIAVQARKPFPPGRARYNCTAPSTSKERWYWYSHPWIIPPAGDPRGD